MRGGKKSKSNATQLTIRNVSLPLSGRYSCEVSADAPSFKTATVSADMHIVVVPEGLPEVEGVRRRYKVGDTLKASCVSQHSRPAANLSWTINGVPLSSDYVKQYRVIRRPSTNLETSLSTIAIELTRDDFKFSGRIKVRCTASLYNIYWRTSETSAEEERPKASVVAAQDYRLNEVLKRPTESPYDVTAPAPSSGCASVVRWFLHSTNLSTILYIIYSCYVILHIYLPLCF